jgi:hypothetical protein
MKNIYYKLINSVGIYVLKYYPIIIFFMNCICHGYTSQPPPSPDLLCKRGRGSCFIYVFVFIYVHWCPTLFPCQMIFASFNSNTTGVANGTGTAKHFRNMSSPPVFSGVRVTRSLLYV